MVNLTRVKWRSHKAKCVKTGVRSLTYDEYCTKIMEAGITASQIGRGVQDYQLGRYTDTGDYTPQSCRFITHLENHKDMSLNGGNGAIRIARSKTFTLRSPTGVIHTGTNLKAFALEHGLDQGNLNAVKLGNKPQYLGWTKP